VDNFGQNEQEGALSPRWFIVQPPVKATPIPVLRDPTNATSVIARLKADTVVKSVSQSAMWLRIELPKSQFGYIHRTDAAADGR
jgi:hypothetical protein